MLEPGPGAGRGSQDSASSDTAQVLWDAHTVLREPRWERGSRRRLPGVSGLALDVKAMPLLLRQLHGRKWVEMKQLK